MLLSDPYPLAKKSSNQLCGLQVISSGTGSQKTGSHIFLIDSFAKQISVVMDIPQKILNEISLGREDSKLSIGGLNGNIPYTVQMLSKILQSAWSWQDRDFNMVLNPKARATEQTTICLL